MNIKDLNKLFYFTWNIGFVDKSIGEVISNSDEILDVHWLKHTYNDRFFADPFLLSADEEKIEVLVEEFPYFQKKGIISLLTVNREYELIDKKIISDQPYHQSYPFILRDGDNIYVIPEASQSGNLYLYKYDRIKQMLIDKRLLICEPLLDSTFFYFDSYWWLFATKNGKDSNRNLYLYYSESLNELFKPAIKQPIISDLNNARPGGCIINSGSDKYRIVQKCEQSYGEAIRICKVNQLCKDKYVENFVKEIRLVDKKYYHGFHTLNGLNNICVVDGLKKDFMPINRVINEIRYIGNKCVKGIY